MTDPVLAFDTSAARCAAAVWYAGSILTAREEPMAKGQGERLMPLLQEVLDAAGLGLRDLAAIGVGIGPGNFTGIRISVAASRGLALSLGIPAVGVSLLEAAALDAGRPALAVQDARRDRLYAQVFGDDGRGPALIDARDLAGWAKADLPVVSYDGPAAPCPVRSPVHPAAEAIARIAATRFRDPDLSRPAPLYLREADAAPSRETGPVMLP